MSLFQHLHQPTDRFIQVDNREYLFFGGTAYLGLLANQEYIDLYKKGIDLYGLNNGTSRSNNVQLGVYGDAEEFLATRFGFEAAAVFSSGYLAAQATVLSLLHDRKVFYAPGSHPSLWRDGHEIPALDFDSWIVQTVAEINSSSENDFVIVSNALDNLTPELYDFSMFSAIDENKRLLLILDDSHGIGIVRKNGITADLAILRSKINVEIVVLASLAKGLGTDAGLVLGDLKSIDRVRAHPIFLGASPSSPAAMYALLHGQDIYEREFEKLVQNTAFFSSLLLENNGFRYVQGFPVFTSENANLAEYLKDEGVLVSSFPYPLQSSALLNRLVVSSLHQKEDLVYLADLCNKISV